MAGEALVLDPTSEDAANVELALSAANGYDLLAHSYPTPERDILWVSSADTEGERIGNYRYKNRQIPVVLRATGSSQAQIATRVQVLQEKLAKLTREGGTLKRTLPGGEVIVFDVLDADADALFDQRFISKFRTQIPITFMCRPFGRGAAVTLADHAETTLPALVFTDTGLKGDVPALGKLVVDEDDGDDQWFVMWGVQSRYYSSATSAKLFYEAEDLTPLGTAAAAAGPTGASGAGSNTILENALIPTYKAILSTQAAGGGAHLSHIGRFQVWARVQCPTANTGAVKVCLEWAEGDFRRFVRNDEVALYPDTTNIGAWEGTWRLVNLGQVDIGRVAQGTQRWEGRMLAKSTVAGDDVYVDCLYLMPVDEGYGEIRALETFASPGSFSARDEFDQSAGALVGKTLPVGGTWSGAGDSDDFAVETTGKTAQRTAVSDTTHRVAIAGTGTFTDVLVQTDVKVSTLLASASSVGVVARYTDVNNFLFGYVGVGQVLAVGYYLAGAGVSLGYVQLPVGSHFPAGSYITIRLKADTGGRYALWVVPQGQPFGDPVVTGQSPVLATGGGLATGKAGLYDYNGDATAVTRNFDNFFVAVPSIDAAVFASQSLEIRHDRVIREDIAGTIWTPVSRYEGDYAFPPPQGSEGRTLRTIVKACRNDPDTGADSAIDDISARWTYTPRYLQIPEA